ncbi:MAG TPA: S41 family peptidase, partial [Thermomicrobiales bacterium]|nr:S41 family peptidase [Thermomicrobiales bacterium]
MRANPLLLLALLALLTACGPGAASLAPTATRTPAATPVSSTPGAARAAATPATPGRVAATPPDTSPDAAAALVVQAVGLLLDHYVDPLQSAALYATAYGGMAQSLRAAGRAAPPAPAFTNAPGRDAAAFRDAYLAAVRDAGPAVNQTVAAYAAIRAVVAQIDECHTSFLDPAQYRQFTAHLAGNEQYGGIGVSIRAQARPAVVGQVFPDTPAARAGLRPGDAILAVDGGDVRDLPADQISTLIRGEPGTAVTLTIRRPGEAAPRDVAIVRARITVPVFASRVIAAPDGRKVGYLQLYSFSSGAENNVRRALEDFQQQGVTAWVLDLRDNGGGYIATLSAIAGLFMKDGPVGYTIQRGGKEEPIATSAKDLFPHQLPLAVLINAGTASAGEAFAAAAQDGGRSRLLGQTSAGCLAGAQTFPLADGSALQITIEKVVSPHRREINRVGVAPDVAIPPPAAGDADPVLDAAVAWATR